MNEQDEDFKRVDEFKDFEFILNTKLQEHVRTSKKLSKKNFKNSFKKQYPSKRQKS